MSVMSLFVAYVYVTVAVTVKVPPGLTLVGDELMLTVHSSAFRDGSGARHEHESQCDHRCEATPHARKVRQRRDGVSRCDAPGRIRTSDLALRRRALYPLSYGRSGAAQCTRDLAYRLRRGARGPHRHA